MCKLRFKNQNYGSDLAVKAPMERKPAVAHLAEKPDIKHYCWFFCFDDGSLSSPAGDIDKQNNAGVLSGRRSACRF